MTNNKLKLLCVLAHPDDESLGVGGTLAKYASEGIDTYIVCATRGERGRFGDATSLPGLEIVGNARELELLAAAKILGVNEVRFLDYIDGDLDKADPAEAIGRIVTHIRRIRPQVVITFGPEGGYGHPDHIAISQFTTAASVIATDGSHDCEGRRPHAVSKLYYMAWPKAKWDAYQFAFKDLKTVIDGTERRATPYPDWVLTTRIDTSKHWQTVWDAVSRHKTQISSYEKLSTLPDEYHKGLWGSQEFYRVFSLVNGGRKVERDLFDGLKEMSSE